MTDSGTATGQEKRLRPQISATVHPDTVERMRELCGKFKMSRGALIDRLVQVLARQYKDARVYCMTGEPCRFNRVDVPEIF